MPGLNVERARALWVLGLGWLAWGEFAIGKGSLTTVLIAVTWLLAALPVSANSSPWNRHRSALAGACAAILWIVDGSEWTLACVVLLGRLVITGKRRDLLGPALAVAVPAILLAVTTVFGLEDAHRAIRATLAAAARAPDELVPRGAALLGASLLSLGTECGESTVVGARSARERALMMALGLSLAWIVLDRSIDSVREALTPSDLRGWAEAPMLSNVLKLRLGLPVYGELRDVNSYVYSPLLEVIHRALLRPFGRDLDVVAHRFLVLGWEITTSALLGAVIGFRFDGSVRGRLAAASCAGVAFFALLASSYTSPHLHPDHALHACVALAVAIVVLRDRLPPWLVVTGSVLVPVLAVAFKLTGVGVLVGLVLAVIVADRERRAWPVFAVSAVLAAATIPLYEVLFGRFTTYAIVLLSHHAVHFGRLFLALRTPYTAFILVSCLAILARRPGAESAGGGRTPPAGFMAGSRALLYLSLGIWVTTTLAFLKEGGSTNNLVAPVLPALTAFVLAVSDGTRRAMDHGLALAAVVGGVMAAGHRDPSERAEAREDHHAAVAFVKDELGRGGRPLSHSTSVWVEAGAPGIPRDALRPAIELYFARDRAFRDFLDHIESGTYTSIVTPGGALSTSPEWHAGFALRYLAALAARYCVVYPTDDAGRAVSLTFGRRTLILRRRDLGCAPFRTVTRP